MSSTTETTTSVSTTDPPVTTTTTSTTSTSTTPDPPTTTTTSTTSGTTTTSTTAETTPTTTATSTTATTPTTTTTTTPRTSETTTATTPQIVTSTSVLSITQSRTSGLPSATSDASSSKGFFQNTGAVAGTFSAVGVIGLIILIILATTAVRRRRAKKFDQEIAEAAREAAATQPPAFLDDDDDYRSGGTGAAYGYGASGAYKSGPYSDVSSHGTYQQSPMAAETYGMREMGHGPAPGEVFDYNNSAGAGAAGIGVARARSMTGNNANYGQALQDGASPYAAFAVPNAASPPPQPHPYAHSGPNDLDVLEAAGLGAHAAGAGASLARGQTQYQNQGQQGYNADGYHDGLHRNKSLVSHEGEIVYPNQPQPTSAGTGQSQYYSSGSDPYAGFNAPQQQPQYAPYPPQQQQQQYPAQAYGDGADDMEDAYGGYVVNDAPAQTQQRGSPPNYDQPKQPAGQSRQGDGYASDNDDEPRMVLKVANQ